VALYHSFTANPDEGWTEWLLDRYQIRHTLIENGDLQKPDLRARFDTILLASQSATSILHGFRAAASTPRREGEPEGSASQRPEFLGGIGAAGTASLEKFVNEGGTLVALDAATELPLQFFPLSILNVLARPAGGGPGEPSFFCPGSLLRLTVEPDQPLAFGMPREAIAFYTGGQAFDGSKDMRSVARFASQNVLASGWLSGERAIAGKHALVELPQGRGRVVLFAFRPQFRGQPAGTFKFLLNAVYLGSAKSM
jgi:hypothetical protein